MRRQSNCNYKPLGGPVNYRYNMATEYEWDEGKRLSNQLKHGVDFSKAEAFEWETAVIHYSPRGAEARYVAVGFIAHRLHYLVYTIRGNNRRIVSLRRANQREQRRYERER